MASVSEINLVVSDLEASRAFYEALGCSMRAVVRPEDEETRAWLTTTGPAPVSVHKEVFAAWWDPSAPGVDLGLR